MWKGYFNQHRACLRLKIYATEAAQESNRIKFFDIPAIIDTGFDGFVQVDFQIAAALGWFGPQTNAGVTQIAAGKVIPVGLFNSPVEIESDTITGTCQFPLRQGAPCLIGMDLLRRAERVLVISKSQVLLPKEQNINLSGT